jgi:hypothetical protein
MIKYIVGFLAANTLLLMLTMEVGELYARYHGMH